MNQRSQDYGNSRATGLTFALLCLPGAGHANASTYFSARMARRAVTVQQTACATNFAQEEEKV